MTPTVALRWYRVTFGAEGLITTCVPTEAPDLLRDPKHNRTFYVLAGGPLHAEERARDHYNLYCAKKRKAVRARNHAAGKCVCGRPQDRPRPDGDGFLKLCAVCAERHTATVERARQRPAPAARDESTRVEKCAARVRDRKNEMRLEVLLEVRTAWESAPNNQAFTRWLRGEVAQALAPRAEAEPEAAGALQGV